MSTRRDRPDEKRADECAGNSSSRSSLVVDEFTKFCGETTAHGYGQLFLTENRFRRFLWAAIISCAVFCTAVHFRSILVEYLEYNTLDMFSSKATSIDLPSVTICNLKPHSTSKKYDLLANETSDLFWWRRELAGPIRHDLLLAPNSSAEDQHMYRQFLTPQGYYENMARSEARYVGHDLDDFITRCEYDRFECPRHKTSFFQHPIYYNCYTLNTRTKESDYRYQIRSMGPANGLSVIVFLESDAHRADGSHKDGTYYRTSNTANAGEIFLFSILSRVRLSFKNPILLKDFHGEH